MRMLLMIGNNAMSLRALYTAVLDTHGAGWGTSFMSGMPAGVDSIVTAYDAVIYELGPADGPDRVAAVTALRQSGALVITHLEGRQTAKRTQELEVAGAVVVANPISAESIGAALDTLVGRTARGRRREAASRKRGWFRRFMGG